MPRPANGVRLPQSLLEQLGSSAENTHLRHKRSFRPAVSRKDARKQEREEKKLRKARFSTGTGGTKRHAQEELSESPQRKKAKVEPAKALRKGKPPVVEKIVAIKKPVPASASSKSAKSKLSVKPKTALEELVGGPTKTAQLTSRGAKETQEDKYIAYLESKLGYAQGGKRKTSAEDDGLDDLFDLASSLVSSGPQQNVMKDEVTSDEDNQDNVDAGDVASVGSDGEDEWPGIDEDAEISTPQLFTSDTEKQAVSAYVPPHLRNKQKTSEEDSEKLAKLRRQLKGLLNRLTEQNMMSILDDIEDVYRNHRRHDVTSTITTLITDGISSRSSLLDSYVVLHAAFVSSLHKLIGVEFAAYFLQNVVTSYERHHLSLEQDTNPDDAIGKECSNLIVLLSELYNFQVISSILVFDIIRGLLERDLTEFNVELLLKITRNSGHQLRQDDPSALKDIMQIVQNKLSSRDDALSSRSRFMIETLTNLKNNKLKRNATQNQGGEAVERMKKFLSGLSKKRHVLAHEPLRVSLEDLHSAESKGKWWLVGAAWGGDPLAERLGDDSTNLKVNETQEASDELTSNALLKLARKQGMNTDIRRSIFVVLMSSDDYVDACERLLQLNLNEVQQREIIRVLLHCCGNEKSYNPYYALVCQHLCRNSHAYRVTVQFCLWDFLRDLGETTVGGVEVIKGLKDSGSTGFDVKSISSTRIQNVARAYAWWIAKDCITLSVLKPVNFTVLKPQSRAFLKSMFTHIFISSQSSMPVISFTNNDLPKSRNRGAVEEIFGKATRITPLVMGIAYFLSELLREKSSEDDVSKLFKWAGDVARDTLRTALDGNHDL